MPSAHRSSRRCAPLPRSPSARARPDRSSRGARPFTSSATSCRERDLDRALQVERVLGPVADQPPGWMAETAHGRVTHRLDDARGQLLPGRALAGVQRELHPVELGEHVVGNVECAVAADVALDAAQHPERRERLVRRGDLDGLPPQRVAVEARERPSRSGCGRRSRGTRSRGRARRRPSRARSPGRPTTCVCTCRSPRICPSSTSAGSSRVELRARESRAGGTAGPAAGRRPPRRLRAAAAERLDDARAARSRGRAPCRARDGDATTSSIGIPSIVTPVPLVEHRDDLRKRGEARSNGVVADLRRPRAASGRRPTAARRRPARRRAPPRSAPVSSRARGSRIGRAGRSAARARPRSSPRGAGRSRVPRAGAATRSRPRARPPSRARAPRRSSARARRWDPSMCEGDELERRRTPQLGQLGDLAGLDQLAQPALRSRPDAAQLLHAPGAARAPPRTPTAHGSARRHGGTHARPASSRRTAPTAPQTRRGAPRSSRCPGRPPSGGGRAGRGSRTQAARRSGTGRRSSPTPTDT